MIVKKNYKIYFCFKSEIKVNNDSEKSDKSNCTTMSYFLQETQNTTVSVYFI